MFCKKTVPDKNAINSIFKSVVIIFTLFSFSLNEKEYDLSFHIKIRNEVPLEGFHWRKGGVNSVTLGYINAYILILQRQLIMVMDMLFNPSGYFRETVLTTRIAH